MKKTKKRLDAQANEWLCTLEWQEEKGRENMNEEFTLKKVENGYILSGGGFTEVYNNFKNVVKRLEIVFGERKKEKKGGKRK